MKYKFDENKINIFTICIESEINDFCKCCIQSWKKVKNANIYIFTEKDIIDTFPGVYENDLIINKIKNNSTLRIKRFCYKNNKITYINNSLKLVNKKKKIGNIFCNDTLRWRLATLIPNSIYLDTDEYILNPESFAKQFYENEIYFYNNAAFFTKVDIYNDVIDIYKEVEKIDKNCFIYDFDVIDILFYRNKTINYQNSECVIHFLSNTKNINNIKTCSNFNLLKNNKNIKYYIFDGDINNILNKDDSFYEKISKQINQPGCLIIKKQLNNDYPEYDEFFKKIQKYLNFKIEYIITFFYTYKIEYLLKEFKELYNIDISNCVFIKS